MYFAHAVCLALTPRAKPHTLQIFNTHTHTIWPVYAVAHAALDSALSTKHKHIVHTHKYTQTST